MYTGDLWGTISFADIQLPLPASQFEVDLECQIILQWYHELDWWIWSAEYGLLQLANNLKQKSEPYLFLANSAQTDMWTLLRIIKYTCF